MTKVKVNLNSRGIHRLLNSEEVANVCLNIARGRAPSGYRVRKQSTGQRTGANIKPETKEAVKDNYENNTLEKIIR